MGAGKNWLKKTNLRKWIYVQELNPTNLPGGVVVVGNSVCINKYTKKDHLKTYYYCIINAKDPTEAQFEALKEFIRMKISIAYLLKIGIVSVQDVCLCKQGMDELDNANKAVFEDYDYVISSTADFFKPIIHNNFTKRAQSLYHKLVPIDKYIYQAGEYLNLAYYLRGFTKESIINFTKMLECLIFGLNKGKKSVKLNDENLKLLRTKLNLTEVEINAIKKLSRARDEIAAHGIIDPELEYIIGQYDPAKRLSKYFVVTCGPNYGLGDLLGSCEGAVRKAFANYIGISF